jgi:serine/threonine protein kinase
MSCCSRCLQPSQSTSLKSTKRKTRSEEKTFPPDIKIPPALVPCLCSTIVQMDTSIANIYLRKVLKTSDCIHIHSGLMQTVFNEFHIIVKISYRNEEIKNLHLLQAIDFSITESTEDLSYSFSTPYIPLLKDYVTKTENDIPCYVMIMAEGPTDLYELNIKYKIPTVSVIQIIRSLVWQVARLHNVEFAHLDLSLENVLYNRMENRCYLIDFEFSQKLDAKKQYHFNTSNDDMVFKGKLNYMSKQQYEAKPIDGFQCDVFAIGVIAFELMLGQSPFIKQQTNQSKLFHNGDLLDLLALFFPTELYNKFISIPSFGSFVRLCCHPDTSQRPRHVKDLLNHPFLKEETEKI